MCVVGSREAYLRLKRKNPIKEAGHQTFCFSGGIFAFYSIFVCPVNESEAFQKLYTIYIQAVLHLSISLCIMPLNETKEALDYISVTEVGKG